MFYPSTSENYNIATCSLFIAKLARNHHNKNAHSKTNRNDTSYRLILFALQ